MLVAYMDNCYEGLWRSKQVIHLIANARIDTLCSIWSSSFPGLCRDHFATYTNRNTTRFMYTTQPSTSRAPASSSLRIEIHNEVFT